jgi:hypothetical protein
MHLFFNVCKYQVQEGVLVIKDRVKLKAAGAKRNSKLFSQVAEWKLRAQGNLSALAPHRTTAVAQAIYT